MPGRDLLELRAVGINGDPVICEECFKSPVYEKEQMLVLAAYFNGELTDLKCTFCRGHIKDAKEIIKELEWAMIRA